MTPNRNAEQPRSIPQLIWRLLLVLGVLFLVSTLIQTVFGERLNEAANSVVQTVGLPGVVVGTWLADGFAFPVPPQTYMLAASSWPEAIRLFPALACGSILGGISAYFFGPVLERIAWLKKMSDSIRSTSESFDSNNWVTTAVVASLSPLAFSWVCYAAGMCRAPRRVLFILCLLRLPKLLLFQAAILGF